MTHLNTLYPSLLFVIIASLLTACADSDKFSDPTQPSTTALNISAPDQVNTGDLVYLSTSVVNEPTAVISVRQVSGTPVSLLESNTNPSFIAPDVTQTETLTFSVRALYGVLYEERTISIQVHPSGISVDAGKDFIATAGNTVSLHALASAQNPPISYHWSQSNPDPVTLTDDTTANPTFSAPIIGAALDFSVNISDASGKTASDSVSVLVEGEKEPAISVAGTPIGFVGDTLSFKVNSDAVSPSWAWRQVSGPSVTLNNRSTNAPSFVAPSVSVETGLTFRVEALSSTNVASTTYATAIVKPTPATSNPLVIDAGTARKTIGGSSIQLNANVIQSGSAVTYLWEQTSGPSVTITNPAQQQASVVLPKVADSFEFKLTVSDGLKSVSDTLLISTALPTVSAASTSKPDASINKFLTGSPLHVLASVSDAAPPLSYSWSIGSGTSCALTSTGASAELTPGIDGTCVLDLSISDSLGNTASTSLNIESGTHTPLAPVIAPSSTLSVVASADGNSTVLEGEIARASAGISGQSGTTSYNWTELTSVGVSIMGATTEHASFTAPSVTVSTPVKLQVEVTDSAGSKTATVDFVIDDRPILPTAPPAIVYDQGDKVSLSAFIGGGKPPYTFTWTESASNPSSVAISDNNQLLAYFTAPTASGAAGLYTFTLNVSDSLSNTGSITVPVRILALPLAPVPTPSSNMAVVAAPIHSVLEGDPATANVAVSNPNGAVTYAWTVADDGGTGLGNGDLQNANTKSVGFTAPSVASDTDIQLSVAVTDSDGTQTRQARVNIVDRNFKLDANPKTVKVDSGHTAHLHVDATGSPKAPETWVWTQQAGATVTLSNANTQNPSFAATAPGHYSFSATLTDNLSNAASTTAAVDVVADLAIDLGGNKTPSFPTKAGDSKVSIHGQVTKGTGSYAYQWALSVSGLSDPANYPVDIASGQGTDNLVVSPKACVLTNTCGAPCPSINGKGECIAFGVDVSLTATDTVSKLSKTEKVNVRWVKSQVSTTPVKPATGIGSCETGSGVTYPAGTQYFANECSGPTFLCGQLYAKRATPCPANSLPGAYVHNKLDGTKEVQYGCIGINTAIASPAAPALSSQTCAYDWFDQASKDDKCTKLSLGDQQYLDFECTYCCVGSECNTPNPNGCPVANKWKPF